jgi:two-component system NarL family sensor kinase
MMKRTLLYLVLLLPIAGIAQVNINTDTLKLDKSKYKDSVSVRKLIDMVFEHKQENFSNALNLSFYSYNRGVELKNLNLQAGALNVSATIYEELGQYQKSLTYHYDALRLFEKAKDSYGTAMLLSNMSRVFNSLNKPADALKYLKKAEDVATKNKQNRVLPFIYNNYTLTYIQLNQLKTALSYALKGDTLDQKFGLKMNRAINANLVGGIYFFLADYNNAEKYFINAKQLARQVNDLITLNRANINIGECVEIKHTADALPYYMDALAYFEKTKDNATVQYVCNNIANYYKAKGNFEQALVYYQKSVKANEQNTNLQAKRNMAALQTQYETEKKEQQIRLLNKENIIQKLSISSRNKTIGIIVGLFLLSGIMGALFYNRYKLKQKAILQAQMLTQQDIITKAVVDAEENERKRIASDLHDGVGQLFSAVKMNLNGLLERLKFDRDEDRYLAENTLALVDESCKEVRTISHQMMPNMLLRSGIASDLKSFIEKIDADSLKVSLEANGFKNKLESNVETMLYRIIQETINNVIKHAKASHLSINLNRHQQGISAVIADNGVGFDTRDTDSFTGIGLKNILTRIAYLKGTIKYDSAPGKGTNVIIDVPIDN